MECTAKSQLPCAHLSVEVVPLPRRPLVLISVAMAILFGIVADLGWRAYTKPRFAVAVAGRTLGALKNPAVAKAALDAVMAQVTPEMEVQVNLPDKFMVRPLDPGERLPVATAEAIQGALLSIIPSLSNATAITVNGRDIVAVADAKTAQMVRDSILDDYKGTILRDASSVEQLKFQETIAWRAKLVKSDSVRTAQEAINILKLGTDKLVTYVVKSGDTGWDIARSYSLTTDQLAKANPAANIENLQIGQALNVQLKEPYVHTQSVSIRMVKESIPFSEQVQKDANLWPWQYEVVAPGIPGVRQLKIRDYRESGQIVKSDVLANDVLEQPKPQVAKQGTKQVPDLGTGSLVYPVVGVLTSTFGPRWGSFHSGIDIAAQMGTPVLAADSGMVTFRGWFGNYGYLLKVDHGGGKETWYGHLNAFNVSLGATVKKGEAIGFVGNTGFSTGPHLHYEVHIDGDAVNPLKFYL